MILLIIDGSDIIIQRLAFLITESGNNNISAVHSAVSYADATALLKEIKPDVVLLDMYLPGRRSADLFKLIKKNNINASVIILANYADAVTKEKYEWVGADFVFDKYNDFEKIPVTIDAIAGRMQKAG
jgi:DNA-binding NarL/FixJ family response regulator